MTDVAHHWNRTATASGYHCTCGRAFESWAGLRSHQAAQRRTVTGPVRVVEGVEPHISIKVADRRKRVTTYRSSTRSNVVQTHRGYVGIVWVPGERTPRYCCEFHQKAAAAREHAALYARAIARETGLPVSPDVQKAKP